MNRSCLPQGGEQRTREHGPGEADPASFFGEMGPHSEELPWKAKSAGLSRRPQRRWGRWVEMELAAGLPQGGNQNWRLGGAPGRRAATQPGGRSHSRSEMPKQEMRCNL